MQAHGDFIEQTSPYLATTYLCVLQEQYQLRTTSPGQRTINLEDQACGPTIDSPWRIYRKALHFLVRSGPTGATTGSLRPFRLRDRPGEGEVSLDAGGMRKESPRPWPLCSPSGSGSSRTPLCVSLAKLCGQGWYRIAMVFFAGSRPRSSAYRGTTNQRLLRGAATL